MDSLPESDFDHITRLASQICETPISLISLVDDKRQWFKSKVGLEASETPIEASFCAIALRSSEIMTVPNALEDSRFRDYATVTEEPHVRFYAGAPLITPGGVAVGTLCTIDREPRGELTPFQNHCLAMLASEVVALLERRKALRNGEEWSSGALLAVRRQTNTRLNNSLRMVSAVSLITGSSMDPAAMLAATLQAICVHTGATVGRALLSAGFSVSQTEAIEVWQTDETPSAIAYQDFARAQAAGATAFLEKAMEAHAVIPLSLLDSDPEMPARNTLLRAGLLAGVAIPIIGQQVLGGIELYGKGADQVLPALLETLGDIGNLLGAAIEREQVRKDAQFKESYFRHLVEDSLDLVTILDAEGMIRFESRSVFTELGWPPEELAGQSAFSFLHPDDVASVAAAFQESLRVDGPTALLCFRFRHRDGSYRFLEGRGNNLLTNPAVNGVVFTSRDVSERVRLQEQFGQLAGGIAHDFNNLLTVVVGYSSAMERDPEVHPKFRSALGEVRTAAQRVASLTGQLLAFSGQQIIQPAALQLDALLQESARSLSTLLGVTARLTFRAGAPGACIFSDLSQLESVLLNLAINARDAMPGMGEIQLSTRVAQVRASFEPGLGDLPTGDYAVISMQDTGHGIPSEIRDRIFEPYFTTKPGGKGSGLGLAACQGIIRQGKGRISVESQVGVGTTFSIYLPLIAAPSAELEHAIPLPKPRDGRRKTVLFAEDEPAIRELGILILEEAGYRVIAGGNGAEALAALSLEAAVPIDLLLSDIMMPVMDGKELAERFRKLQPGVPILFCSGFAQDASFYEGLPGGTHLLPKPYTISALLNKLELLLAA